MYLNPRKIVGQYVKDTDVPITLHQQQEDLSIQRDDIVINPN